MYRWWLKRVTQTSGVQIYVKRPLRAQWMGREEGHICKPRNQLNNLTSLCHRQSYFQSTNQICLLLWRLPLLQIPLAVLGSTHHLPCACMDLPCPVQVNPVLCNSIATISPSSSKNEILNARTSDLLNPSAAPASQTAAPLKSRKLLNFSLVTLHLTGPPSNPMLRNSIGPKTNQRIPWRP